ncbi:hypothetical protein ACFJIW_17505 [Tahibacter sp. UC22_41]|uniref:hypothetical protein n=1 Tax=Tahibacter sp. UC22_41 TaxID=3350178 RepID=UPI0036DDC88B
MLAAGVLFASSYFCFFNVRACGMIEPILAAYLLAVAVPLMLAGWFRGRRWRLACAIAYLLAACPVVAAVGQHWHWW